MEQNNPNEVMDKLHHQILKDWNLRGSLVKDFISIVVREFKAENNLKDDMDIVLKKLSEDVIARIFGGMENHLGNFGTSNLKMALKTWIEHSIDGEIQRRVSQANGLDGGKSSQPGQPAQSDSSKSNNADGGLNYIQ